MLGGGWKVVTGFKSDVRWWMTVRSSHVVSGSSLTRDHPGHYGLVGFSGMFAHPNDTCHCCHVSCRVVIGEKSDRHFEFQISKMGGIGGKPNLRLEIRAQISR
ncbi:hypothetical protein TIFTF001_044435 [Ficus carica]|nr:hypothetical protein TIFTF001_044425 [Ficus carica]GMN30225.1 hypothetical protein TIFTF001_044435 [Ficus carica]